MEPQKSQIELENYLIATVFEGDAFHDVFDGSTAIGVCEDSFTDQRNAEVWKIFAEIKTSGGLLEEGNVVAILSKNPKSYIDSSDIFAYGLIEASPSQFELTANGLVRNWTLRKLRREFKIALEAIEEGEDPEHIISNAVKSIENIDSTGESDLSIKDIAERVYGDFLDDNKPSKEYYPTGLTDYDSTLDGKGFCGGQYTVWAARPGLGKTTVVLNAAMHLANMGVSVGFISLEMSEDQLGKKIAVMDCGIPAAIFKDKIATPDQKKKMNKSLKEIAKLPLYIDHRSRSLPQVLSKIKIWAKKKKIKVAIIDYCQLIRGDKRLSREQQIADISRELKLLALELDIEVKLVAQINRESEKEDRRPRMSDLRESGALEQDADVITFLYLKGEDVVLGEPEYVRWYRAKQREGPTAEGIFGFKRNLGIFTSYANNPDLLP